MDRRSSLKKIAGSAAVITAATSLSNRIMAHENSVGTQLKGKVNHSVCRWIYQDIPIDTLCKSAKDIGIESIDLVGPEDFATLKKHGLTTAMVRDPGMGIAKGFNNLKYHDELIKLYEDLIPKAADAGLKNVICLSGNREGMSDEQGLKNAALGLKKLMKLAESKKIVVVMELLNSKIDHADYMCDHTKWGVELCNMVGSENFKLLYDIYHMQIMEGDVIRTIKENHKYIAHYHTGGVPGRNEIDDTQELFYPAIMKAIVDTGFKGFVAQEFIPKRPDRMASLKQGVQICDI